jgi:hypothetical protein
MHDLKLLKFVIVLIALPIGLAMCGGDKFRYPCQDPANWDKDICKFPQCDVTRTCPEHVFKGQRDPRLGPPKDGINGPLPSAQSLTQGASCGK